MPTLLIPFLTNALQLTVPQQAVEAMADFRRVPYFDRKVGRVRHADNPYISENMLSQPFQNEHLRLESGVHLHFVLPMSLIAPIKRLDPTTQQKAADDYPPVPNRWMVIKKGRGGQADTQWIVESDYLWAENAPYTDTRHAVTILLSKAAMAKQPDSDARFRYIGRSYKLTEWLEKGEQGQYWRDFYGESITALGYNEPTFASFYPNCRSVFGFHDAQGEKGDQYEIWGWYSHASDHTLLTEFYQSDAIFESYSSYWKLLQSTQQKANTLTSEQIPAFLLQCRERLKALAFQAASGGLPTYNEEQFRRAEKEIDTLTDLKTLTAYLQSKHNQNLAEIKIQAFSEDMDWKIQNLPSNDPKLPDSFLFHSSVQVGDTLKELPKQPSTDGIAIGNTGTEALSAYLAQQIDPTQQADIEDLIESVQFDDLYAEKLDLTYKFEEARHQKSFNPRSGGKIWQLDLNDKSAAQQQFADANASKVADQLLEEKDLADRRTKLAELMDEFNFLQNQYDQQQGFIHSKQHQLFADWYKYMLCAHPPLDRSTSYPKADTVMRFLNQRVIKDLHQYIEKTEILLTNHTGKIQQIAPMNVLAKAQNLNELAQVYQQIRQSTQQLFRERYTALLLQLQQEKSYKGLQQTEAAILKHWSRDNSRLKPTSEIPPKLNADWLQEHKSLQDFSKIEQQDLAKCLLGLGALKEFQTWYPSNAPKKKGGLLGGLFGKKDKKTSDPIAELTKKHSPVALQQLLHHLAQPYQATAANQKTLQKLKPLQLKQAETAQAADLLRIYQLLPADLLTAIDEQRLQKLLKVISYSLVEQIDINALVKWILSLALAKSLNALSFIQPVLQQYKILQSWIAGLKTNDEKTEFTTALKNLQQYYTEHWNEDFAALSADSLIKQWIEATKQVTTFEELKGIYPQLHQNQSENKEHSSLLGTWLSRLSTSKTWKQWMQVVKNTDEHLTKVLQVSYLKTYFKNLFVQVSDLDNIFEVSFQFLTPRFDAKNLQNRVKAALRPQSGEDSPLTKLLSETLDKEAIAAHLKEITEVDSPAKLEEKQSAIQSLLEKQKEKVGNVSEKIYTSNIARLQDLALLQALQNDLIVYRKQPAKKLGLSDVRGALLSIVPGSGANYLPKGSLLQQMMVIFYDIHREIHLLNRQTEQKIQEKIPKPLPKEKESAPLAPSNPLLKKVVKKQEMIWKYPQLQDRKLQFRLLGKPGPRYYESKEPVVLISGEASKSSVPILEDAQKTLDKTYLDTIQIYTEGKTDKQKIKTLAENGLEASNQLSKWKLQSEFWNPLLLEWAVDYIPIDDPSINAQYQKDFIQQFFELAVATPDFTLKSEQIPNIEKLLSKQYRHYTGSTILTPNAPMVLQRQIKEFLSKADPEKDAEKFKELKLALDKLKSEQLSILTQSLGGFNQSLLMRKQTMQLEVDDPICMPEYRPLVDNIRQYIGGAIRSAPEPKHYFNPIKAGVLSVDELRLVDSFGQVRSVYNDQLKKAGAKKIIASNTLKLSKVKENTEQLDMEYIASQKFDAVLMPRIVQPLRLDVRWLAATNDQKVSANHKDSSPICGWIVPNFLNLTIVLFDSEGELLGEMGLFERKGKQLLRLIPPPGLASFPNEKLSNIHLKNMVTYFLKKGVAYFNEFLQLIHESVMYSDPKNFAQHTDLAMLVGRPLALVRAKVNFELMEDYAIDQDWNVFQKDLLNMGSRAYKRTTYDFEKVQIPIQLGDYRQLNDGLFGFWTVGGKDAEKIDADDEFFSSYQLGYQQKEGWVMQQSLDGKPIHLNMLFDPRGELNVFSGLLPVKTLDIPSAHYRKALEKMRIYFALGPFVTPRNQFRIPIPESASLQWNWVWQQENNLLEVSSRPSVRKTVLEKAWLEAKMPSAVVVWNALLNAKWVEPIDDASKEKQVKMNLNVEERIALSGKVGAWQQVIVKMLPEPKVKEKAYLTKQSFEKAWKAAKLGQAEMVWKLLLHNKWLLQETGENSNMTGKVFVNEDKDSRNTLSENLQKQQTSIEKILEVVVAQKQPVLQRTVFEQTWNRIRQSQSALVWKSLLSLNWLEEIPDSSSRAYINYDIKTRKPFDELTPVQAGDENLINGVFDAHYEGIGALQTDANFGQMELREGWLKLMNEW